MTYCRSRRQKILVNILTSSIDSRRIHDPPSHKYPSKVRDILQNTQNFRHQITTKTEAQHLSLHPKRKPPPRRLHILTQSHEPIILNQLAHPVLQERDPLLGWCRPVQCQLLFHGESGWIGARLASLPVLRVGVCVAARSFRGEACLFCAGVWLLGLRTCVRVRHGLKL